MRVFYFCTLVFDQVPSDETWICLESEWELSYIFEWKSPHKGTLLGYPREYDGPLDRYIPRLMNLE